MSGAHQLFVRRADPDDNESLCALLEADNCATFSAGYAITRRDIVPAIESHFVSVIVEGHSTNATQSFVVQHRMIVIARVGEAVGNFEPGKVDAPAVESSLGVVVNA